MGKDKKKRGLLGGLVGAFVETEEDKAPEETEPAVEVKPTSAPAPVAMPVVAGEVDPAIFERLMAQVNTKGPFLQFTEMVESLKDVIPDEAMRFQAALKAVEKTGLSPERIAKSLAERSSVLQSEQEDFGQTVAGRQKEIDTLELEATGIGLEIEELKKQIADKEAAKKAKEEDVAREKQGLAEMQSKFAAAVAAVQKVLQEAEGKLSKYLMGGK